MSDQQFLIVPSSGGKAGGSKKKTPFNFFLQEKRQQWEKEGRWDGRRSQDELVQAALPLWAEVKKSPRLMEPHIRLHRQCIVGFQIRLIKNFLFTRPPHMKQEKKIEVTEGQFRAGLELNQNQFFITKIVSCICFLQSFKKQQNVLETFG